MKIDKEIIDLFQIRDKAVEKKDKKLFLSTQAGEISGSSSTGYLSVDEMKTKILTVSSQKEFPLIRIVIVEESYFTKGKKTHQTTLLYYLIKTIKGWKIYNIIY